LPGSGDFHFDVPEYYLYAVPVSVIIALVFLTYFGARFGTESRKRAKALNKLELILAKEHELESIGQQAAAAAHSLGTPLSTITVIAKELEKEIKNEPKYLKDINLLLSQAKRCGDILKKISKKQIVDDKFMSDVSIQNLLIEITKSFEEISKKEIFLNLEKAKESLIIDRSPEITYGIRNFIGNAVKYSNNKVEVNLEKNSNHIKINIIDDGPGFPEDVFKIIGQPYITSKSKDLSSKAGLGLGTFIGKTLLERKKATLMFSNSEEGGAIVTIAWKINDLKI
jgi:two-component system sensor histidine kinase RegB